jgi:sigma-B regulation protein RsbU (phosphoserine phosphatase)
MTTARALLHGMSATSGEIEGTLQQLNLQLAGDVRPGHFMTLFYVEIDRQQHRLRYASAGHDPILWWHADTGQCTTLAGVDIPLGIDPQWQFSPASEALLTVGDVFLMATDGVWETRSASGDAFGKARLESLLARHARNAAHDILEAVLQDLSAFAHDMAPRDDVTVVVVRIDSSPALA